MTMKRLSPWYGSKSSMASMIAEQLGPHLSYWEPFCGGMSVLLTKSPCASEVVNDLHGDLINLARVIQHKVYGPKLYRRLRRVLAHEDCVNESNIICSQKDIVSAKPDLMRAYHYFIISWVGRTGLSGSCSIPKSGMSVGWAAGAHQAGSRFTSAVKSIPVWRDRLRKVTILRRDGFEVLSKIRDESGVSIYVDPPYLVKTGDYIYDFTDKDHKRLSEILNRFQKARVVLSYYKHDVLNTLYKSNKWLTIDATQTKHIAGSSRIGLNKQESPEVLIVNGPSYSYSGNNLFGRA